MHRWVWLLGLSAGLLAAPGCSSGPRLYKVSGLVTLDGKPLPEADILFVPADTRYGPEPGRVKDGRFEFLAKEGGKRVEISASRPLRKAGQGEMVGEANVIYVEYIPEHYNVKSVLTAEVTPDGPNEFEFKLTSAKKK